MAIETSTLTDKNNASVYNETTKPKKPKRRDKSDLGPNFIAPDGGWGWVICFASGFSNLSLFPPLQQYGFIYRQRMADLHFDAKQTTTIVNIVMAISSLVGIVNGAIFRRFTFRQVAMTGSLMAFVGLFSSAFCVTFVQYIIFYSILYGIGVGLAMAATSLAVNTYFKTRRRRATGFSWTITGLGPIVFPHLSTFLLGYYGVQGTILVYSGIILNAFVCAITLQPVLWHARKPEKTADEKNGEGVALNGNATATEDLECKYCQHQKHDKPGIFSSQYLFNDDDPERPGYEIIEPMTPMLARANDGWYGSKVSLNSEHGGAARNRRPRHISERSRQGVETTKSGEPDGQQDSALYKPNYFNRQHEDRERYASKASVYSKPGVDDCQCTCAEEKEMLQKTSDAELKLEQEKLKAAQEAEELAKKNMTFGTKVARFFDLDLLKDFTFVNLLMGMTIMMFGEMNFSVLTPFILHSYNFTNAQMSVAISVLGVVDILVRFLAPFLLEKVKLDNRVLFAFGIIAIAIGRFLVTLTRSFEVMICIFGLIGFGKGFRTIFASLLIPSYVPLKRLPAASGLQLVFNAIFVFAFGPVLGIITDATNYTVTIHVINFLTCTALLMWLGESLVRRALNKKPIVMNG